MLIATKKKFLKWVFKASEIHFQAVLYIKSLPGSELKVPMLLLLNKILLTTYFSTHE